MSTLIETIANPVHTAHFVANTLSILAHRIEDRITIAKLRNVDDHTLRQFGLNRVEIEVLN